MGEWPRRRRRPSVRRPVLSPDGWIFKAGTNEFSNTAPSEPPMVTAPRGREREGGRTDTTFRSPPSRCRPAVRLRSRSQHRKGQNFVIHLGHRCKNSSRFGEFWAPLLQPRASQTQPKLNSTPDLADNLRALILTEVRGRLGFPQGFRLNQATLLVGFA